MNIDLRKSVAISVSYSDWFSFRCPKVQQDVKQDRINNHNLVERQESPSAHGNSKNFIR